MNCSVRWGYRSWPYTRPLGPRSSLRPARSVGQRRLTWHFGHPPLRFSAPSTRSTRGVHFPAARSRLALATRSSLDLVAGFHTRFGPPSSFFTTSTVYSSSCPVACFSHSRPWGWGSCSPRGVRSAMVLRPLQSDVGGGGFVREVSGWFSALARFRVPWLRSAAPVACAPVPVPAPRVSMLDCHPSPTRRGVCSFGDRTALGFPTTAARTGYRRGSVCPAYKPGLSLSPDLDPSVACYRFEGPVPPGPGP